MPIKITREENERLVTIIHEGAAKAVEILKIFPEGTRGLMTFFAALEGLRARFPALFKHAEEATAARMILHWVIAGEPENPGSVPELLAQKYGPEAYREIEESYIAPEKVN
jgi:hypothetical protein